MGSVLNLSMSLNGANARTIREYLKKLLLELWIKGEGFSGKRPFGDSGWELELITPLVTHGIIEGRLDEDGFLDDYNEEDANRIIQDAIQEMCDQQ